jgi:PKD repeat protein
VVNPAGCGIVEVMHRALLLTLAIAAGCESPGGTVRDLGPADRVPRLEALSSGEGGGGASVDFVVQGCAKRTADRCLGTVPLTLTLSAVVEATPTGASWDFGDGTPPQPGLAVSHRFDQIGSFTITLSVPVAGGTVSERKESFVVVDAVGPGGPCSSSAACASGQCVCQQGCPFPLSAGLCLHECEKVACHSPATACVDLSAGDAAESEPWRRQLCLPTCALDADCTRPGFQCRDAPTTGGWTKVCMPPFPRAIGAPCRAGDGSPDPAACLGKLCLDLGATGVCSASCGSASCPEGSRCAHFSGEGLPAQVCLRRCVGAFDPCGKSDPQLACELPSSSGFYGFVIAGPPDPAGTRYCAVKRCQPASEASCGITGRCDLQKGGFCVPAS